MPRRTYDSRFKSKVALEAIRGEKTVAQIGWQFGVHPNLVAQWKREALEGLAECFATKAETKSNAPRWTEDSLMRQIGSGVSPPICLLVRQSWAGPSRAKACSSGPGSEPFLGKGASRSGLEVPFERARLIEIGEHDCGLDAPRPEGPCVVAATVVACRAGAGWRRRVREELGFEV